MSTRRLQREAERVRERVERGDPYWPAPLTVALASSRWPLW
jgi:hypothetical protein